MHTLLKTGVNHFCKSKKYHQHWMCVCEYTVMHSCSHIRTQTHTYSFFLRGRVTKSWTPREGLIKDELAGTHLHTLTHTHTFLYYFDVEHSVVVHVFSLRCDQARPPAGDLGWGGAVLEERHVAAVRGKRGTLCDSYEMLYRSQQYDSHTVAPSVWLESIVVL